MQTLTYEGVKAACRDAYCRKRLTAQAPAIYRKCWYKSGDYRCAIGCAMTDETLGKVAAVNTKNIWAVQSVGLVKMQHGEHMALEELQYLHDEWVRYGTARAEQSFLRAIYSSPR